MVLWRFSRKNTLGIRGQGSTFAFGQWWISGLDFGSGLMGRFFGDRELT